MKNILVLLLFLCFKLNSFATHNYGGHITYKATGTFTYHITLTTYTDVRSVEADRPVVTINFGDGKEKSISRKSQHRVSELINENIYETQHDYSAAGQGNYRISYSDANRIKDIVNIDNSVSQLFYLESLLVIDLEECENSSAAFSNLPIFKASANSSVLQSLNIFDENGDSLVYELVKPLQAQDSALNAYSFPKALKIIDKQIYWQPENTSGMYLIAIKIKEYRNSKLMGYTIKEWVTNLIPTENPLKINSPCNAADSVVCKYDGRNGNSISFSLKVPGLTKANGKIEMIAPDIIFEGNEPAFDVTEDAGGNLVGKFSWQPAKQNIREQLMNFVFLATKNDKPTIQNQMLVNIYVDGKSPEPCSKILAVPFAENVFESMNVYPNPFTGSATIRLNNFATGITCSIFNMQGQKVAEIAAENGIVPLDGKNFSAGIYTYHIATTHKILGSGKFVVQK